VATVALAFDRALTFFFFDVERGICGWSRLTVGVFS
jgi:hypothetical protein